MFIKNGSFIKYKHIISYVPVTIFEQPIGGIKGSGTNYTFSVFIRGSEPLTYQWYKNNFPIENQKTDKLTLTNMLTSDSGKYFCKVGNNTYTINTDTVTLSVIDPPTIVTDLSSSYSVFYGENVSMTISATDIYPLSYQWYKDGSTINATGSSYHIYQAGVDDIGIYYVTVSNLASTVTSISAELNVYID
jgi:hypothetical protein